MEIPDGAVEAAIRSGDGLLDEVPDGTVREGCEGALLGWSRTTPGSCLGYC